MFGYVIYVTIDNSAIVGYYTAAATALDAAVIGLRALSTGFLFDTFTAVEVTQVA